MPIDTFKELDFYADMNMWVLSDLVLPIKSNEPEKICLIFKKRGNSL